VLCKVIEEVHIIALQNPLVI